MRAFLSATAAATLIAFGPSHSVMARSPHALPPISNHISGRVAVPHQDSATLPPAVQNWLRSLGLRYVIPRVPYGFPPVSALQAAHAAAHHTPVGAHPGIQVLALISPTTAFHPLVNHAIYWAVVLRAHDSAADDYYVTFVNVQSAAVVGSLHHLR